MKWGSPPIGGIKEFGVHCCGDDFDRTPGLAMKAIGQVASGITGGPNLMAMLPPKKSNGDLPPM